MTQARCVQARKFLLAAITAAKSANEYAVSGFDIGESYLPHLSIEAATENGKVWLLGLASDQNVLSRPPANAAEEFIPITVAYQKLLPGNPDSDDVTTLIDNLLLFVQQLQDTCRNLDVRGLAWQRNEALRDPSGTPYSYTGLRDANVFESYFTAFYKSLISTT